MERLRESISIVKATALEILSEPLSLLVLLAALAIAVLAPAFHYHQFGEATRMARDAGFSALFACGGVFAVFGTIRAFRREIESGTLEMALAHPISRARFFFAKTVGALVACLAFAAIVLFTALTIVEGAAVGGAIAQRTGDIARLWGPCFAAGVGIAVVPLVAGAALNRFARCRFVLSAFAVALVLSALAAGWVTVRDARLVGRLLPVAALVIALMSVLLLAAAVFSVRWKANAAAAAVGIVVLALVPVIGNYYRPDALANGGAVTWGYVAWATLALLPALVFFALIGFHFVQGRDVT